jgi:hypothetical protein
MGCGSSWACRTCKVHLYLGYGSYGRHEERVRQWAPVLDHEGHDTLDWIDDSEYGEENDTLYQMGSYGTRGFPMLEHLSEYAYRNLESERDDAYKRAHPPKPLPESTGNLELDRKLHAWEARKK